MKFKMTIALPLLLAGGCAPYYRVKNCLMAHADGFAMYGKAIVMGVEESPMFPKFGDFAFVRNEDGGTLVYRATFHPRKPRIYCIALAYECPEARRISPCRHHLLEQELEFNGDVEIEVFHNGKLFEREIGSVRGSAIGLFEPNTISHNIGSVYVCDVPWKCTDEITVYVRISDENVKERLRRNGARMFVYEYNRLDM